MKVKSEREVAQSCPTLLDPMDCSLPGSSVRGTSRQDKANINKPTKKLTVIVGDFNIPFSSWIDHPDKN